MSTHPYTTERLERLELIFKSSPRKKELLKVARSVSDNLFRALVPLYLARGSTVDVTSPIASKWWAQHGVKISGPVVARALREHVGYARQMKTTGLQITPNGVKYVEACIVARQRVIPGVKNSFGYVA